METETLDNSVVGATANSGASQSAEVSSDVASLSEKVSTMAEFNNEDSAPENTASASSEGQASSDGNLNQSGQSSSPAEKGGTTTLEKPNGEVITIQGTLDSATKQEFEKKGWFVNGKPVDFAKIHKSYSEMEKVHTLARTELSNMHSQLEQLTAKEEPVAEDTEETAETSYASALAAYAPLEALVNKIDNGSATLEDLAPLKAEIARGKKEAEKEYNNKMYQLRVDKTLRERGIMPANNKNDPTVVRDSTKAVIEKLLTEDEKKNPALVGAYIANNAKPIHALAALIYPRLYNKENGKNNSVLAQRVLADHPELSNHFVTTGRALEQVKNMQQSIATAKNEGYQAGLKDGAKGRTASAGVNVGGAAPSNRTATEQMQDKIELLNEIRNL